MDPHHAPAQAAVRLFASSSREFLVPDLLSSVTTELSTDFAILTANQSGHYFAEAGTFAGTAPGALSAICGTKYADVRVRAERWDGRPPHQFGWEDADELPFEAVSGAGPLVLGGFEPSDAALDVGDLGRARVLVRARGRQRYGYSDILDGQPPEEWLLQFYPDPKELDALSGDPRRLSGQAPFGPIHRTGWSACMHAWQQTGWHQYLYSLPGYYGLHLGLLMSGHAVPRSELFREVVFRLGGTHDESVPHRDPHDVPLQSRTITEPQDPALLESVQTETRQLALVAAGAGISEITVVGHLIQALVNLGLLLPIHRKGQELLVPNACPGMVWDVLDISEQARDSIRVQIGYADFRHVAADIDNMLLWAPSQILTTTPRRLAIRLAVTSDEVLGAFELLDLTDRARHVRIAGGPDRPEDGPLDVVDATFELARPIRGSA